MLHNLKNFIQKIKYSSLISLLILSILIYLKRDADIRVIDNIISAELYLERSKLDSALITIRSTTPSRISSNRLSARHSLLHSKILDKNFIDLTIDSIIKPAKRYYAKNGDSHQKAQMYYYSGRIYHNAKDKESAIKEFTEAKIHANRTEDYYMRALIHSILGHLYFYEDSFENSIEEYKLASDNWLKLNLSDRAANAYGIISESYFLLRDYSSAILYNNKAKDIFISQKNWDKVLYLNATIASILIRKEKLDAAKKIITDGYEKYNDNKISHYDYINWANIYFAEKNFPKAKEFATRALDKDKSQRREEAGIYRLLSEIEYEANNLDQSMIFYAQYSKRIISKYESDKEIFAQEIVAAYNKKRLQDSYDRLKERSLLIRTIYLLLALFIIVISSGIIYKLIRNRKRLVAKLEREKIENMAYVDNLQNELSDIRGRYSSLIKDEDTSQLPPKFFNAFEGRLNQLKELAEYAYILESNPASFHSRFKTFFGESVKTEGAFGDLQYLVNKKYFGIIDYIKDLNPKLSDADLDFFSMICFGFSTNAIRLIYGHTNHNSVFIKRRKLRIKLNLPSEIQLETYIKSLTKELEKGKSFQ